MSVLRDGWERSSGSGPAGRDNALGEFLRSRRRLLMPEAAGLRPDLRRRQVPGLRREELAELAGVSVDYYTRLEQGRERSPSDQVVDALARALRLSGIDAGHLARLARPVTAVAEPEPSAEVGIDVLTTISALSLAPVAVLGPSLDVLAMNPLGRAFYGGFARTDNLLAMVLLDPGARTFYGEWEMTARAVVASVRAASAQYPRHRRIAEVIAETAARSPDFARLWTAQEITHAPCVQTHLMRHPRIGDVHLYCSTLAVVGAPGQCLQVFCPIPGSESAERLARLG